MLEYANVVSLAQQTPRSLDVLVHQTAFQWTGLTMVPTTVVIFQMKVKVSKGKKFVFFLVSDSR